MIDVADNSVITRNGSRLRSALRCGGEKSSEERWDGDPFGASKRAHATPLEWDAKGPITASCGAACFLSVIFKVSSPWRATFSVSQIFHAIFYYGTMTKIFRLLGCVLKIRIDTGYSVTQHCSWQRNTKVFWETLKLLKSIYLVAFLRA